jgi:hypothetical protein
MAHSSNPRAPSSPKPEGQHYSVYVRHRTSRLALKRSTSLEEARAFADEVRRLRFHDPEAVFVVDDVTGEEVPAEAASEQAPVDPTEPGSPSSEIMLVVSLPPAEFATLERLAHAGGLTPIGYLRALITRTGGAPKRSPSPPTVRVDPRTRRRPR